MNVKAAAQLALTMFPFAAVFAGCWMIYPPVAWIATGLLVWIDLNHEGRDE